MAVNSCFHHIMSQPVHLSIVRTANVPFAISRVIELGHGTELLEPQVFACSARIRSQRQLSCDIARNSNA
jgi:hypothetical protein